MSNKLRITLGVLLLVAAFLVVRVVHTIGNRLATSDTTSIVRSQGTARISSPEDLMETFEDSDADGLPDDQETTYESDTRKADTDGDGFLDGEEAISGYDPITNGEGDKMVPDNATKGFTDKLIAGLYSGDLNPRKTETSAIQNNLSAVALTTLTEASQKLSGETDQQIHIIDNSTASQEEYLKKIAVIFDDVFMDYYTVYPKLMTEGTVALANKQYARSGKAFQTLADASTEKYTQLVVLPVPEKYKTLHEEMLAMFSFFTNNLTALAHYEQDPLLGYYALLRINNAGSLLPSVVQDTRDAVKGTNLNLPPSPLFETFSLINENL